MRYTYLIIFSIVAFAAVLCSPTAGFASILLSADNFAILAGSTVTNTGNTSVNGGDIGVWAGAGYSDLGVLTHSGALHLGDAVAQTAQGDLTTAFNGLAGMPVSLNGDLTGQGLGGLTLFPGVYKYASTGAHLTGTLYLDAQHNNNVAWVFQIGTTLITDPNAHVVLLNPGSNNGVFWQVGSSATIDTGTTFAGNILADQMIALNTGATLDGRALARITQVTLQGNTINAGLSGGLEYDQNGHIVPLGPQGPGPSTVPEPSTMLLLGLGGVATAFIKGRRKA
jgi:hypothetical protein